MRPLSGDQYIYRGQLVVVVGCLSHHALPALPLPHTCCQVTNTPWNERVTFAFDPAGASVRKALHVSPFMDMQGTW